MHRIRWRMIFQWLVLLFVKRRRMSPSVTGYAPYFLLCTYTIPVAWEAQDEVTRRSIMLCAHKNGTSIQVRENHALKVN
ncbi:uncharacterized protein PHALS_15148 [Plasmopara halstedii]|uniref:Uncharacterized protein n=1 Tax=Plasmopara halstedii TaxID=4781 RepID=A0A0P1B2T7_PLAHL|nr:uncharacterized protein PHALS_15148 [Plasmopara halstedii]CEG48364.1 hypothetical protein PHALS_15148 [Plasmopara halstedii]|eukprot:XP_024584733.1 hypothetical protein PHALS_15148 [Plasmopara halstedii]